MRGVFKSLFLLLIIAGIFIALSFVMTASAKVTHAPATKTIIYRVNVWNPFPPPIEKPKDGDGIAGNVWNPFPPPIEDPDDDDGGIAGDVWNPFPPPIEKPKDGDGIASLVNGSVWNPFPPPIEKPKDGGE